MFEDVVATTLKNDSEVLSLVSSVGALPSIHNLSAPPETPFRYIVYRIETYPEGSSASRFQLMIDIFDYGLDGSNANTLAKRIKFLFKDKSFSNSDYSNIRIFQCQIFDVEEPDHRAIHKNIRFEARAIESGWISQITT